MNISEAVDILEGIRQSLIKEYDNNNHEDELIKNKIGALKYIIKFTHIIFRCFPKGFIKKIVKEDTKRNDNMTKEIIEIYNENNKTELNDDENLIEKIYTEEIKLRNNYRLLFSVIKYKGKKYIIIEPKKYNRNILQWINWERFNFPAEIIKENQFRKKINKGNI
jgi:hypothetical protein